MDEVSVALYDCNFDTEATINVLLEGGHDQVGFNKDLFLKIHTRDAYIQVYLSLPLSYSVSIIYLISRYIYLLKS